MIKNDLFLRALKGKTVNRPPVWMMRQAGRYLPEFQEIKAKYDFFTRCQTPELASEITVQPFFPQSFLFPSLEGLGVGSAFSHKHQTTKT